MACIPGVSGSSHSVLLGIEYDLEIAERVGVVVNVLIAGRIVSSNGIRWPFDYGMT